MKNNQFVRNWLISSSLFFIITNIIDFILTFQINDWIWYFIGFIISFGLFGPIIAILITEYKNTHRNNHKHLQI